MKGAYVAQIPVAACSPRTVVLEVRRLQVFTENRVQAFCSCSLPEMEHRLQSSNVPRVRRAGQPKQPVTICLEDTTGTLPRYKMQLGESTAVEEEFFPNNKGCALGGRGGYCT